MSHDLPEYENPPPLASQLMTWANLATTVRMILGTAAFAIALIERSMEWNLIGLAIYWSLDIADGFLARKLNQETLFGAQYDILVDRIQVAFFYLVYASFYPEKIWVIALFLLQFMVFDHYLSNQFLRYKIISPNYFYRVDKHVFNLLWSPIGKALNTGLVTLLILLVPTIIPALIATLGLIGIRVYCIVRMMQVKTPILPEPPEIEPANESTSEPASESPNESTFASASEAASQPGA